MNKQKKKRYKGMHIAAILQRTAIYDLYKERIDKFNKNVNYLQLTTLVDKEKTDIINFLIDKLKENWNNINEFWLCFRTIFSYLVLCCSDVITITEFVSASREIIKETLIKFNQEYDDLSKYIEIKLFQIKTYTSELYRCLFWHLNGKKIYRVSNNLVDMLDLTKLEGVPSNVIRLPFNSIYLDFPEKIRESLTKQLHEFIKDLLYKETTNLALNDIQVEGVILDNIITDHYIDPYSDINSINTNKDFITKTEPFNIIGTIVYKNKNKINLHPVGWVVKCRDEKTYTSDSNIELITTDSFTTLYTKDYMLNEFISIKTAAEYANKVLLYLTTTEADTLLAKNSPEYAKWTQTLNKYPPGHKKRGYIFNILKHTDETDTILLGREIIIDRHKRKNNNFEDSKDKKLRAIHWRSGHFRLQPFGPRTMPEYHTIWIKPQLIGVKSEAENRKDLSSVPTLRTAR